MDFISISVCKCNRTCDTSERVEPRNGNVLSTSSTKELGNVGHSCLASASWTRPPVALASSHSLSKRMKFSFRVREQTHVACASRVFDCRNVELTCAIARRGLPHLCRDDRERRLGREGRKLVTCSARSDLHLVLDLRRRLLLDRRVERFPSNVEGIDASWI